MTEIRKKAGRPRKTQSTDTAAIMKKMEEAKAKISAKAADNLTELFDVIFNIATSPDPKASPTNKISCAKYCLELAAKHLEELEEGKPSEGETPEEEEEEIGELISLTAIG